LAHKPKRNRLIPLRQKDLPLTTWRSVSGKGGNRIKDTPGRRRCGFALPTNPTRTTTADQGDKHEKRHKHASAEAPTIGPAKHPIFSHSRFAKHYAKLNFRLNNRVQRFNANIKS
jgi:hypothetical protein